MTITQVLQETKNGAVLIRLRGDRIKGQPIQYDCKPLFTGSKRGWTVLDSFTAGAMKAVYAALRPDLQAKFDTIPLMRLLDVVWKHVK